MLKENNNNLKSYRNKNSDGTAVA